MSRPSNYLPHLLWLFLLSLVHHPHADVCQDGSKTEVPSSCMALQDCNELRYLQNHYGANATRFYLNQLACEWNDNDTEPTKFCCPNDTVARQMTPPPAWPNGPLSPPFCGTQVPTVKADTQMDVMSQWSWMVDIVFQSYTTGEITFVCSGTLISGLHVLTAAKCIMGMRYPINRVRLRGFGRDNVSQINPYPVYHYTRGAAVNSEYNSQKAFNDIAILKLATEIPWDVVRSGFVRPICLPVLDFDNHENLLNGTLRLYDDDLDVDEAPVEYRFHDILFDMTRSRSLIVIISRSAKEHPHPAQIYGAPVVNSITAHTNGTYYILGIHVEDPREANENTEWAGICTGVRNQLDWIRWGLFTNDLTNI